MNDGSVGNDMTEEKVTKTEFKARALEYFRQVEQLGHTLVVTDRGQPTIEVKRYREDTRSPGVFHKDPADRIIVALARHFNVPLVTADERISNYKSVKTLW